MTAEGELPFCDVDFAPEQLRFGIVEAGRAVALEFVIRNRTGATCQLRNLRLCEGTDPALDLPGAPYDRVVLPGGGRASFMLRFTPEADTCGEGPEGCVEVEVGPAPEDRRTWTLDCPAPSAVPQALLAPDVVDFGAARPGCSLPTRELQVINTVSRPITLDAVELSEGTNGGFSIVAGPPPGTVIPPGLAVSVTLGFRPEAEVTVTGEVRVRIQGDPAPYTATLIAGAAGPSLQRDSFAQGGTSGPRDCFALATLPEDGDGDGSIDGEELRVLLDEVEIPSTVGGEPVWAYDAGANRVCFAPDHVPAEGTWIEIEYFVPCLSR